MDKQSIKDVWWGDFRPLEWIVVLPLWLGSCLVVGLVALVGYGSLIVKKWSNNTE